MDLILSLEFWSFGAPFLISLLALAVSLRSTRYAATSIGCGWLRDVRSWATECVSALTVAIYQSEHLPSADCKTVRQGIIERLSALVDQGRFLLPNHSHRWIGTHKPPAYRGLRHPALDALIAAIRVLESHKTPNGFGSQHEALDGVRREYVSIVQDILDPRSFNRVIDRILRDATKARERDAGLWGVVGTPDGPPPGAEGILRIAAARQALSGRGTPSEHRSSSVDSAA